MRRDEKIELILKHLGKNGWLFSKEDRDRLYNSKGKIGTHLTGHYALGKKIILKSKDYIYIDDDSLELEGDDWQATVFLYANGSGFLIIPILYHTITEKDKINFGCREYYVDLTNCTTEEDIADVIAQCEEKIAQVKFKVKEYESKIREQKMKKDF